jgi:DNA-binding LytR/AlgR family response regulator
LLLDDELPGLTYLKMLCEQLPELEIVRSFNDPEIFLAEQKKLDYDLCILDIEMPGMDGITVAGQLEGKPVIFTTAYREYAADAFDLNAIDYIRKPVKKERLAQAVTKAMSQIQKGKPVKNHFQQNTDKGKAIIRFNDLIYITTSETDSRDKTAHLADGSSLTMKNISFEKILKLLPRDAFCRINKRDVVAVRSISFYTHEQVTVNIHPSEPGSVTLALSEAYRSEFVQRVAGLKK